MLRYLMTGGNDPKQYVIHLLLCIPIILLSLSLHETMHGYVAYKLGDPTAKNLGRLTLNPLKHLDPLGFLCMLLMGFGWANPVPINTRYFKNPRRDMAISAIAGPLSNCRCCWSARPKGWASSPLMPQPSHWRISILSPSSLWRTS